MTATTVTDRPAPGARGVRRALTERGVDTVLLLLVPAVLLIGVLFLYPFIYGVVISLQPENGGPPLANYRAFFGDPYLRGTVWNTLRLAAPASVVGVSAALPLAYRMRGAFRGKRLVTVLFLLPMTFGSVLLSEGMTQIFAPRGWVNLSLHAVGLPAVRFLYSYTGTFIVLILTLLPFSFLLLVGMFGNVDPALESAAASLGAGPATRFWRILVPLMSPGITTAFTLALVESFAVFPSAVLVGQPDRATHVLSIPLYQAAQQRFDYSAAASIAMVMTLVELVILGVLMVVQSRLYQGAATGGKG